MSLSDAITRMDLSDLVTLRETINDLMGRRRHVLIDDRVKNSSMIGMVLPIWKGRGRGRKLVRTVQVNAEIIEYDKGKLTVRVLQPAAHLGWEAEISEELVHEPFPIVEEAQEEG